MNWTQLLFSFRGRVNRGKYWLGICCIISVMIAFFIVLYSEVMPSGDGADILWLAIGVIIGLPMTWAGYALATKRLHDRNKSGWWILLFVIVPSFLGNAQKFTEDATVSLVFGLISFIISIWALVELGFLRGTSGTNQYGPDPLGGFSNEPLR